MDKPLHVIYKVSKLAYRIWVILIANKRVKKNYFFVMESLWLGLRDNLHPKAIVP
jgi:hypothetical protein